MNVQAQKRKFLAVRIEQAHAEQLEDLRRDRSRRAGKRVSVRELMSEALAKYLELHTTTH